MPLHWIAWSRVTARHGIHFPEDRFYSLGGVPSRDILQMLSREQNIPLDPIAVSHEKEMEYLPMLPQVRAIDQVMNIAHEFYGKLPMAVASGGQKAIIEQVLRHLGVHHYFKAIVTSEDVTRQKPSPDIFLEAARRIGVLPIHCRAYEDTDLGMRSILDAGMEAVDVRVMLGMAQANSEACWAGGFRQM